MCRWMAWLGQPVLIDELLFKTQHGIVDQSLHSRMGAETTNGDGFGMGWYGAGEGPGVYHSVAPAWGDANLRELAAPHRVAAVPRARARGDRLAGAADQLPPVPPRQLAVRAQRLHQRLPPPAARPHARDRARPVRRRPGLDRHRGRLPPRADARAGVRPDRRARAHRRADRGRRRASTASPRRCRGRSASPTGPRCGPCATRPKARARTLFASADVDAVKRLHPGEPAPAAAQRGRPPDRLRAVRRPPRASGTRSPRRRRSPCAAAARWRSARSSRGCTPTATVTQRDPSALNT